MEKNENQNHIIVNDVLHSIDNRMYVHCSLSNFYKCLLFLVIVYCVYKVQLRIKCMQRLYLMIFISVGLNVHRTMSITQTPQIMLLLHDIEPDFKRAKHREKNISKNQHKYTRGLNSCENVSNMYETCRYDVSMEILRLNNILINSAVFDRCCCPLINPSISQFQRFILMDYSF